MKALKRRFAAVVSLAALCAGAALAQPNPRMPPGFPVPGAQEQEPPLRACFLLYDLNVGELRRSPAQGCSRQVAPAATFEIAAALAGLDASVARGNEGGGRGLGAALAYSSPDNASSLTQNLSPTRMGEYLSRFNYGNANTRGGGEYWNDGSLAISPEEQMQFLRRLFREELPIGRPAMTEVQLQLRQPPGALVGSYGLVPVGPIPPRIDTAMLGKSGSVVVGGKEAVRWQIGQITRGTRRLVFVSCVTGPRNLPENAAALLASGELRNGGAF
ncbi:MAG: penicillin-binding transpeptidase domain-containing protein [Lysobacter sp.]